MLRRGASAPPQRDEGARGSVSVVLAGLLASEMTRAKQQIERRWFQRAPAKTTRQLREASDYRPPSERKVLHLRR